MSGTSSKLKLPITGITNISNLKFNSTNKYIHTVWNQTNHDKGIYLSSSSDFGKNFNSPKKIIDTQGDVKEVQIISRDNRIVITIIERISGRDTLRAASGVVNNDGTYKFKPCEKFECKGEIINAYTTFTQDASEDHIFYKLNDDSGIQEAKVGNVIDYTVQGHPCSLSERPL